MSPRTRALVAEPVAPPAPEVSSVPPMLELIGVRAGYGRIEVLHGVDLVVPRGSVVALLGPNGGGKTSTLQVASGQLPATAGCVHTGGRHANRPGERPVGKEGGSTGRLRWVPDR